MKCPLCAQQIPDDSVFCECCGSKIPRCPTCGTVISGRMNFCEVDGTRIPDEINALFDEETTLLEEAPQPVKPAPVPIPPRPPVAESYAKPPQEQKSSSKGMVILLIALLAVVILLGALAAFFMTDGFGMYADDDDDDDRRYRKRTESTEQAPTEEPTTEPATEPATEPVVTYTYRYEIIAGDYSWLEADAACRERGGYLATIDSPEEYQTICRQVEQFNSNRADGKKMVYLWMGASLHYGSRDWKWSTGESIPLSNYYWYKGEPSYEDNGVPENYLCLWDLSHNGYDWTLNDQRNDIVQDFPSLSGKVGYICEYKEEVRN